MLDVFFHLIELLLEGDRAGIQGCSILGMGCVYCFLETLYIRLKLGNVVLKLFQMCIVNRSLVRFLFDSSMFETKFLTDVLQEVHQLSIRIGICKVVLPLCKGNSIVVCLGCRIRSACFNLGLSPKMK